MAKNSVLYSNADKSLDLAKRIMTQDDSIDVTPFGTLVEGLKRSKETKQFFKRIVFTSNGFREGKALEDIKHLKNYLENLSPNTELVYIFRESDPDEYLTAFNETFNHPNYTVALLDSGVTMQTMVEVFKSDVTEVRAKYLLLGREVKKVTKANNSGSKPKKPGLFAKLFGGKKKVDTTEQTSVEPQIASEEPTGNFGTPVGGFETSFEEPNFNEQGVSPQQEQPQLSINEVLGISDEDDDFQEVSSIVTPTNDFSLGGSVGTGLIPDDYEEGHYSEPANTDLPESSVPSGFENSVTGEIDKQRVVTSVADSNDFPPHSVTKKSISFNVGAEPLVVFGSSSLEIIEDFLNSSSRTVVVVDNTKGNKFKWYIKRGVKIDSYHKNSHWSEFMGRSNVIILEDISSIGKYYGAGSLNTHLVLSSNIDMLAEEVEVLDSLDNALAELVSRGIVTYSGSEMSNVDLVVKDATFSYLDWGGLIS